MQGNPRARSEYLLDLPMLYRIEVIRNDGKRESRRTLLCFACSRVVDKIALKSRNARENHVTLKSDKKFECDT